MTRGGKRSGRDYRTVFGTESDPIVQMLAPMPPDGRVTFASHHKYLAAGGMCQGSGEPVGLVLRRRNCDQTDAEWRVSIELALRVTEQGSDCDRQFYCLSDDARAALADITDRDIRVLPAPPRTQMPCLEAIWSPNDGRITLPGPDTYLDDMALNWARLRERLTLTVTEDAPPDCADIAAFANRGAVELPDQPGAILTLIPNGVGLGHLTRQLAAARHLRQMGLTVRFWCYSQAAGLIAKDGFEVIPRQTAEHLRMDSAPWSLHEAAELASFLQNSETRTVIQDAGRVSPALAAALRDPKSGDIRLVLVRRGMWQPGKNSGWRDTEQLCDLVLEPSDLAREADAGATQASPPANRGYSRFVSVPPTILTAQNDALSRADARHALGLTERGPICLISLGGDALVSNTGAALLIRDAARRAKIRLAWLTSPLASVDPVLGEDELVIRAFPIAHLFAAFDGFVTAAGYNSFHEALMTTDIPVLLVPQQHTRLDDQTRRAAFARQKGWAHVLDRSDAGTGTDTLDRFFSDVRRGDRISRDILATDGATRMAELIAGVARREHQKASGS